MIFNRRKSTPEPAPSSPASAPTSSTELPDVNAPDLFFPFATRGTVYWVNFHVMNYVRDRGHQPQPRGTSILLEDGREIGLHDLVAAANTPGQDIERLVNERMPMLLTTPAMSDGPADPSTIFVRLYDRSRLPADPRTGATLTPCYAPVEVFPGIVAILAIEETDAVRPLFDDLSLVNGDVDTAYRHAFQNLHTLPTPEVSIFSSDETQENSLVYLFTSPHFGASRALALPLVLADALGETIPEDGALVVMPNSYVMAVHLIKDGSVASAIPKMVELGEELCDPMPDPISPVVYHMSANLEGSRFARRGENGIVVEAQPPVAASLRRLGVM